MMVGIDFEEVDSKDLRFSKIVTTPDNPYFKTGDVTILKLTREWSDIKDGNFVMVKNEGEALEKFKNIIFKVSFNKEDITLSPLSSFVPYKEKIIKFDDLDKVKLTGKLLGIVRGLSDEILLDKLKVTPAEERE